jgi:hypothetical protein
MNKRTWILVVVALLMIGSTAGVLVRLKTHQRLGRPGVKTSPLAQSKNLEVILPELVLDYTSERIEEDENVIGILPKDTSFGQRLYRAPDKFWTQVNVVLMGSDRTSLHKPQFCLEGAGWHIDPVASRQESVRIERPLAYDLPVMKILVTKQVEHQGQVQTMRGVYVYWFVAEDAYTAQHWQRMWWMARELLHTGVLQRWAYVSCFAVCLPGQEEATFERQKKLIAASVPEFQLTPKPPKPVMTAHP